MTTRTRPIRRRWQRYRTAIMLSPLLLTASMTGCAKDSGRYIQGPEVSVAPPATAEARYPSLAGTWAYEEHGKTVLITLNEEGNGTYDWKDGRFMTATYSNGVWKGSWSQRENDRDGGFEVILSQDKPEGEGRWWYTRIGSDTSPSQPGGIFQIVRRSTASWRNSRTSHSTDSSTPRIYNEQARSRENR